RSRKQSFARCAVSARWGTRIRGTRSSATRGKRDHGVAPERCPRSCASDLPKLFRVSLAKRAPVLEATELLLVVQLGRDGPDRADSRNRQKQEGGSGSGRPESTQTRQLRCDCRNAP